MFFFGPLVRLRRELSPDRSQFFQLLLPFLGQTLRFALSALMRFLLSAKPSVGFFGTPELLFLSLTQCFNSSVKCLLLLGTLLRRGFSLRAHAFQLAQPLHLCFDTPR